MRAEVHTSTVSLLLWMVSSSVRTDETATVHATYDKKQPSSLVLLQLVFRHGDRSPIHMFPWIHDSDWPQGSGQLTRLGMKQAYSYGLRLRAMYPDFIPPFYWRVQVETRSTDRDRTLMTVQCMLAGLFPSNMTDWAPATWQPIPVHTRHVDRDQLLAHAPCPLLEQLQNEARSSPPFVQLRTKYQTLFTDLAKATGIQVDEDIAHQISDTTYCEHMHGRQAAWVTDKLLRELIQYRDDWAALEYLSPSQTRLYGGPLLAQMLQNMEERAANASSTQKLFLFSGHDHNIVGLARTLGVFNGLQPPYLTSILLELHQQGGQFFVRFLFDNASLSDFRPNDLQRYNLSHPPSPALHIEGCEELCPLSKFRDLLQSYLLLPEDREQACAIASTASFWHNNGTAILASALTVVAAAVILLAYKLKRARLCQTDTASHIQYSRLLQNCADNEEDDDQLDHLGL